MVCFDKVDHQKKKERKSFFFLFLPVQEDTAIGHVQFMRVVDRQQ
jgi:hypothetical protein